MTTAGYLGFVGALDEILRDMQAAGQLRNDINPQAVRSALIGIFEGILRDQMLAAIDGFPSSASSNDLRQLFGLLLPALAPRPHDAG